MTKPQLSEERFLTTDVTDVTDCADGKTVVSHP